MDDQIEWLDDHTLIYEVATTPLFKAIEFNLYTIDLTAVAPTQVLWMKDARSPTIVCAGSWGHESD